ncbi:MAG: hypothetical protein OXK76_13350 [Gammaproteobacteria bacterium]|nr:hypothetical protein [Gammaproteobacteria bacterium]
MQFVNAVIAVALLVLAVLNLGDPPGASMFLFGAVLAAVALKRWLGARSVRVLAFLAAGTLFCYFGQFFYLVPHLQPSWYWEWRGDALQAAALLFSGFVMIPVLSEYSCRMKATRECERGRREFESRKPLLAGFRGFGIGS